jgi:hypothetical protein
VEALEADISGDFRLAAQNKAKSIDLDRITGKLPLFSGKYGYFPKQTEFSAYFSKRV